MLEGLEDRRVLATSSVWNGLDSGPGSLRAAIALADSNSGPDTIDFAPDVTEVTLTSDQPTLTTDVTIVGGATGVTITRDLVADAFRSFEVTAGASAGLENLTITGGRADGGSGIDNLSHHVFDLSHPDIYSTGRLSCTSLPGFAS